MGDMRESSEMSPEDVEFVYSFRLKLLKLKTNETDSDVTLISKDNVRIKAHKIILRTCAYFDRLFNSRQDQNEYHIKNIDFVNIDLILKYIYAGLVDITPNNFYSLFQSSCELELERLAKRVFKNRPKDVIDMENWIVLFRFAINEKDDEFFDELNLFIKNNLMTFVKCINFFALELVELKQLMSPPSRFFDTCQDYHTVILTWWRTKQQSTTNDLPIGTIVELLNVKWGFEEDSDDDDDDDDDDDYDDSTIKEDDDEENKPDIDDQQKKKELNNTIAQIQAQTPRVDLIRIRNTNELVSPAKSSNKRKNSSSPIPTSPFIEGLLDTTKRHKLNYSDEYLDEVMGFIARANEANLNSSSEMEKFQLEYEKIRFRSFKDGGFKGRPPMKFFSMFATYDYFKAKNLESKGRNLKYFIGHTIEKCYMCGTSCGSKQTITYGPWLEQHFEAKHKIK